MNLKALLGQEALAEIEDGMVVGLGSGSTANYFIKALGAALEAGDLDQIIGVPTSSASRDLALEVGIQIMDIDDVRLIDVLVDGADECTRDLEGIKGGGGALLQEKIVSQYSRRTVWLITEDKLVDTLGAFPLAVEVVKFGSWKTFRTFQQIGMQPSFRKRGPDSLFVTDSEHYLIDLELGHIQNPRQLSFDLKNIVGVVDHGLFLNDADRLLVAKAGGEIEIIDKE